MSEQTKEQSVWHDKDDTLESKVYQAIGAGSMCWSETPKGVFDSDNAKKYGDALWKAIEADRAALLRERDEAVRLLGQITGQVRTLPGNTEIGFDFVMLLKRIDGFLSTQGSNTETTHPSPQSDTPSAPLPLSMTEEEIERIGNEYRNRIKTHDIPNGLDEGYIIGIKAGLRYASTHTKTITVDQIMEVAAEWLNEMEGMHSYMNTYLLRDRLTSKFK